MIQGGRGLFGYLKFMTPSEVQLHLFLYLYCLNPISWKHRTAFALCMSPVCSKLMSLLSFLTASLIFSGFLSWLPKLCKAKADEILQAFCALQEASFWVVTGVYKGLYSFDYLCLLKKCSWVFFLFFWDENFWKIHSIGKTVTFHLQYSQIHFVKYILYFLYNIICIYFFSCTWTLIWMFSTIITIEKKLLQSVCQ